MKPVKNHYFCIGAYRAKMLFKEKHNADNFIRFNAEEIYEQSGKAPVRSYYCQFCGGWHVTSIVSRQEGEKRDERDSARMVMYKTGTVKKEDPIVCTKTQEPTPAFTIQPTMTEAELVISKIERWTVDLIRCDAGEYVSISDEYSKKKQTYSLICRYDDDKKRFKVLKKTMKRRLKLKKAELIYAVLFGNTEVESWIELEEGIVACEDWNELMTYKSVVVELAANVDPLRERINQSAYDILKAGVCSLNTTYELTQKRISDRINAHMYRTQLIGLIDSLEEARHFYGEGRMEDCLKLVKDGLTQLNGFHEDKNVSIIKQHYMKWYKSLSEQLRSDDNVA